MVLELAIVTILLIVATTIIAVSGADLAISSWFNIEGKWPIGDLFLWQVFYHLDRFPAISLGVAGLVIYMLSFGRRKRPHWRRSGAFLVLLLILGPGLLVNTFFKDNWGRPRPREVLDFGGKSQFLHPWQNVMHGEGRSFPSGHASAAFYMSAPFFIYRRKNKRVARIWLMCGLTFGVFMSIARISQGGHFLSDTLWAWGVVHLTAILLYYLLRLDRDVSEPSTDESHTCST
jgi:membrane-associated PAP2 superfamily phosphatase